MTRKNNINNQETEESEEALSKKIEALKEYHERKGIKTEEIIIETEDGKYYSSVSGYLENNK